MLAGLGTGRFATPADAVERFVARDRVFEPSPERHAAYADQLDKYRRLFPLLHGFLKAL